MAEEGDRVYIDLDDRPKYHQLENEHFFKNNKENKELFLFAMAVGFKYDRPLPINKREGYILYIRFTPEEMALINAVAFYHTDDIKILNSKQAAFKIAEEYANAGIKIITDELNSSAYGDFSRRIEKRLNGVFEEIGEVKIP